MPYNFVADSFHTKKLCIKSYSRLSSSEVPLHRNLLFCFFEPPPPGDLSATDKDYLRLIVFCRFVIHAFVRQTDGQNAHGKTASAFHAAR